MPFYDYQCPKCFTKQEVRRSMTDKSLVCCPCGYICRKLLNREFAIGGDMDIDQYDDVRKSKPKWLKFHDGHREKFDATKHGYRKGGESHRGKKKQKTQGD